MDIKLTKEQQEAIRKAQESGGTVTFTFDPPKPEKWEPHRDLQWNPQFVSERTRMDKINSVLLAYRCEFAADYVVPPVGEIAYSVCIGRDGIADTKIDKLWRDFGKVYMPHNIAKQFCDDFNAGRIDFGVEV